VTAARRAEGGSSRLRHPWTPYKAERPAARGSAGSIGRPNSNMAVFSAFLDEVRRLARLLAAKVDAQLLGQTEFEVCDAALKLVSEAKSA
jgi:hypothetical protein